jgi:hypothetical protein
VAGMTITSALAISENVIRVTFSEQPFFSTLLEPDDASSGRHYIVTPIAGTVGLDGNPVRSVTALYATQDPSDPTGSTLDVVLDRPMTPAPAQYQIEIVGTTDFTTRSPSVPDPTFLTFTSVFKQVARPQLDAAAPSRDIGNPQTAGALLDPLPVTSNPLALGTFNADDTGDYSFDQGLVSYKKRVLRRGITTPNGFAHLPGYGVGIPGYGKKLASPATREKIAANYQAQILKEPETASVVVTARTGTDPHLVFFVVKAKMKGGQSTSFALPFAVA